MKETTPERAPRTRSSATRRSFLRAVGAGFACSPLLPFLRVLEDSVAHAAGETPPLRFVTMYHPHGIAAETWVMRGADSEKSFDLTFTEPLSGASCPLAPLDPTSRDCSSSKGSICFRTPRDTTRRERS